jgi:hypothetical protein
MEVKLLNTWNSVKCLPMQEDDDVQVRFSMRIVSRETFTCHGKLVQLCGCFSAI